MGNLSGMLMLKKYKTLVENLLKELNLGQSVILNLIFNNT